MNIKNFLRKILLISLVNKNYRFSDLFVQSSTSKNKFEELKNQAFSFAVC